MKGPMPPLFAEDHVREWLHPVTGELIATMRRDTITIHKTEWEIGFVDALRELVEAIRVAVSNTERVTPKGAHPGVRVSIPRKW